MNARAVVVGATEISAHEVGLEAQYHPATSWEHAYHAAERALVLRELFVLECLRRGLLASRPRDERTTQAAIETLLSRAVPERLVEEQRCLEFYLDHPDKFVGEPLYDVSHILLGAPPEDPEARLAARAAAEQLRAELLARPESFERRARERSGCPSAGSGGRLGQVSPGETEAQFESVLRRLQPGELSEAIETRHGWHLIRLEARAEGKRLPFELVRDRIRTFLEEREFRAALHAFVLELGTRYGVQGFDLESQAPEPARVPAGPRRLRVVH